MWRWKRQKKVEAGKPVSGNNKRQQEASALEMCQVSDRRAGA